MALFDSIADLYEGWFKTLLGKYVASYEKELILKLAVPENGEKMLDIGIGTGFFTMDFVKMGLQVKGVDVSEKMLEIAKKKGLNVLKAEAENLPFSDNEFSLVLSITTLEFIRVPEVAIKEMYRVCKSGGRIVIGTLGANSWWAYKRKKEALKNSSSIFNEVHFFSYNELKNLGLKFSSSVKVRGAIFAPPYDNKISVALGFLIEKIFQFLFPFFGAFLILRIDKE